MIDQQPTPVLLEPRVEGTTTSTRLSGRRLAWARILWFVIAGLTIALSLISIPAVFAGRLEVFAGRAEALAALGLTPQFAAIHFTVMSLLVRVTFTAAALLIFLRRSDDWTAIFVSLMLVTWGNGIVGGLYMGASGNEVLDRLAGLLTGIGHATFLIFLFTMPESKFYPKWTRWLAWGWSAWVIAWNIFPEAPFSPTSWGGWGPVVAFLPAYGAAHILQTYREKHYYNAQQKQQIKWILTGLLIALVFGFMLAFLPELAIPALDAPTPTGVLWNLASDTVVNIALTAIPITIAFSIQRYRLWDVDFVINRSLVYSVLTILLAVLFVGNTLLIQWVMERFMGQQQSPIAYAISAVVIGATFQPVRSRLQRLIDRTFYGINVNYRQSNMPLGLNYQGTSLGPYQVLESIGRGGMAEVYKGMHPTLGRAVAIKVLPPRLAGESDFRTRFEREAQTIAALRHPNIIQVYDFGQVENTYFMVMEYIAGKDLAAYLRESKKLSLVEARDYLHDIASALDYAHEQGVVHRDVKPSNVMLQPRSAEGTNALRDRAILMDFGIAKMTGGSTGITKTGMMGTLDYVAPEQIRASKEVDGRADVYALGVMAYQMLTGELPFAGDNPGAVLIAHMQTPAPDPRRLVPNLAPHVAAAILRALMKEPEARYQTAGAFAAALEAVEG